MPTVVGLVERCGATARGGGRELFLVTQAFGLKGAAALRGRPPGPQELRLQTPGEREPRTPVRTGAGRAEGSLGVRHTASRLCRRT